MPKNFNFYSLLALMFAISAGMSPASAEFFGCHDKPGRVLASYTSAPSHNDAGRFTHEFAAQSRPRITIYPRRLGPNATRQCRSWLVKEYRVSGPVIVPQTRCWWN